MIEVILGIGYVLAVPPLFVILKALRRASEGWASLTLGAELVGAALITFGWFRKENTPATLINLSWLVIFSGLLIRARLKKKPGSSGN